jgi:hypothetical protein
MIPQIDDIYESKCATLNQREAYRIKERLKEQRIIRFYEDTDKTLAKGKTLKDNKNLN